MNVRVKRIYDKPELADGYRMLVDRLWPRGLSKEDAAIDEWNKDIAPSVALRTWFGHRPELFEAFTERYGAELAAKHEALNRMKAIALEQGLTLLYATRDPHINQAVVLLAVLEQMA